MTMEFTPSDLAALIEQNSNAGLISVLEAIQARCRFVPREAMILASERLGLPLSQVYSVATFYNAFTLKPRGKHLVHVCLGTACHVRGSGQLLQKVAKTLHVQPGETTPDREYTLETVNCLGACALGPVMVVDGAYHGQMNPARVEAALQGHNGNGKQGPAE